MAETKKTEAAAAAAPPEAACLTLRQKLVEMRKACPEIVKKQHSDGVSYKYAKIYDVWEKITPIMNELGVDFDVISEQATRHAENGDPVYWITMQTKTRNGDKLMFLYEADLTIRWLNLDNAVGWNDDPAKAKGAAHTYALKYYLFEKFTVDQGEDDPDNSDFGAQGKGSGAGGRQQATQGRQGQSSGRLSDAQLARLYFGTGEVREWYQYGGQPHHFKVLSDNPSLVNSNLDLFLKLLRTVKRRSSWLDAILICLTGEMFLYSGMAVRDHTQEVHVMGSDEIHIYHAAVVHDNNRETVSIGTDAAVISD